MTTQQLPYWLAALHTYINPRLVLAWLEKFQTLEALFHASIDDYQAAGIAEKYTALLKTPNWSAVEKDLAWAEQAEQHIVAYVDDAYPSLLKEISDPPLILFVRGNVSVLERPQLAIVGSRNATPAGVVNAEQFSRFLAAAGLVITSGLARGIDGAAHRGALYSKGTTIAVTGAGLHHIYPSSHRSLAEEMVLQGSAVLSEFPLDTLPQPMNFPRRNRIIAGLSMGVLVVEAALKSGSLITARHALEHGREVFAIPGSIHQPQTKGCHHLIRQGAKLVETAADIVEELKAFLPQVTRPLADPRIAQPEPSSVREKRVFSNIGHEITHLDVIILRSGLTASEVSSILLTLELAGYIQSTPGGYVRVVPNQ